MPGAEGIAAVVTGAAVTGGGEGVQKRSNSWRWSRLCDAGGMAGAGAVVGGRNRRDGRGGSTSCSVLTSWGSSTSWNAPSGRLEENSLAKQVIDYV